MDKQSLIVGYDPARGERRGTVTDRKKNEDAFGDCIDCFACVRTCPTGIDIRDGLQMECIHCTQCIDACDEIMDKIEKPRGLIRYTSQDELARANRRFLRGRTMAYPMVLLVVLGFLTASIASQKGADVTVLRGLGAPFSMVGEDRVSNQIRIKIVNRTSGERAYRIELENAPDAELIAPQNPLVVPAGASAETSVFVVVAATSFTAGERPIEFEIEDDKGFEGEYAYKLLGPGSSWRPAVRHIQKAPWFWPGLVVGLLALSVAINLVAMLVATDDPSHAIEADYYEKALAWDEAMAQERHNGALGWRLKADVFPSASQAGSANVIVALSDRGDGPIAGASVTVETFHNARAGKILAGALKETEPGRYAAALPMHRDGWWELRFRVESGGDVFTDVKTMDLRFTGAAP
ncbi:MAG: FixH family protein [Deltaproteobacteria bacterium]|nr:FixH family protein [Deltaproteobacteria bacterium]